jgi:hypothetical protein
MMNGNSSKGWDISFDLFPPEDKIVHGVLQNRLTLVAEGAEENEYDRDIDLTNVDDMMTPSQQAATLKKGATPQKIFSHPPQQDMATATSYVEQWRKMAFDQVKWEILKDDDEISRDMPNPDPEGCIPKLTFDLDTNLEKLFFDKMMPCVAGHALVIDNHFEDPRADMHLPVKNDGIKFHDPDADDLDWQVKYCYILLITYASEWRMERNIFGRVARQVVGIAMPTSFSTV